MKITFRKAAVIFLRVFLVVFSFIVDVKVRADVLLQGFTGPVEVEKDGAVLPLAPGRDFTEPLEVQTFQTGSFKAQINSIHVGMAEHTLLEVDKTPELEMPWGMALVSAPVKVKDWLTIRTPQGDITTSGGDLLISVRDGKTQVSVLSGRAQIKDRSDRSFQNIRAGYQSWIGGLKSDGSHAKGRVVALDFDLDMTWFKVLGDETKSEWQSRYDRLKPLWKQAVEDVARETQDEVNGDLQLYHDIQEAQAKKEERERREDARLRALFRRKTLGDPRWRYENTADPSESDRAPASSGE